MNTSTTIPQVKKTVSLLPEIWYAIFLVCSIAGTGRYLWNTGGDTLNIILFFIGLCILGLLIKQCIRQNGWVSFYMGAIFTLGSAYMSLALLSEYREFPLGTEPGAISLITVGGLLCGASLVFAIWMLIKGIRKIQS